MKKLILLLALSLTTLGITPPSFAATTQVDSLIEKLVDKGVLTRAEGIKLKGEIAADAKIVQEDSLKQSLPKWVQDMKLKGDFRLRYQWEQNQNDEEARARARVRMRLGVESKITDQVKVGAGLATGGTDPRSTNETFENTFEHAGITFDYAYAEYTPLEVKDTHKVSVIAGKLLNKDYLWRPTDMLWDSDINPEGFSTHLEKNINKDTIAYLNSGFWMIDENGAIDKPDPSMHYFQSGLKWKNDTFDANVAGIYYGFNAVKGTDLDNEQNSNTQTGFTNTDSTLNFDYDSLGLSGEVGVANPFGLPIPRLAVFADYIYNIDTDDDNLGVLNAIHDGDGYSLGFVLGDKKIENFGKWQLKYIYTRLGKDAFPDVFPDSDRFSGGETDVLAHEGIFEFGLTKNVSLGIDYYQSRRIKAVSTSTEHLVQGDINFKF